MSLRLLFLPAAALLVAACTNIPASPPTASNCNSEAARAYLGKLATPNTLEAARKAASADMVRTLKPDQAVTLEYLDGRLNLHVDAGNAIIRATCG